MNSNKLDEAFAGQSALRFELGGGDQDDYGDQSGTDDDLISQQHVMNSFLTLKREMPDHQMLMQPQQGPHRMQESHYRSQLREEIESHFKRPQQTASEKKRRDLIKNGYERLAQMCVKTCNQVEGSKLSHAAILTRAASYIDNLEYDIKSLADEKRQIETQINTMIALKQTYFNLSCKNEAPRTRPVTQEQAFAVFRGVMDALYESFRQFISLDGFTAVAQTLLKWAEVHCRPHYLHQFAESSLMRFRNGLPFSRP